MENKNNKKALHFTIDGRQFDWEQQFITGIEIRQKGNVPEDFHIYLVVEKPGENELIKNADKVDLARQGIEHFVSDKASWKLIIDDKHFEWHHQYISGEDLRQLGNITADYQIFLSIKDPWKDELIKNEDKVDLALPGIERFFTKHIISEKTIYIDDEKYNTSAEFLTPNQIMQLANIDKTDHYLKQIIGTEQISYKDKPEEKIKIVSGMKFVSIYVGPVTVSNIK
jgi:hypothetical protein